MPGKSITVAVIALAFAVAMCRADDFIDRYVTENSDMTDPCAPWHILSAPFANTSEASYAIDGTVKEWEYATFVTDEVEGILSVVLSNPRSNTPIVSSIGIELVAVIKNATSGAVIQDFHEAGTYYTTSSTVRDMVVNNTETGVWCRLTCTRGTRPTLRIVMKTASFFTDLSVSRMWPERDRLPVRSTPYRVGKDLQPLGTGLEFFTWDEIWPTTTTSGTLTVLATGQTSNLAGHGYREFSFGRWSVVMGGWDFALFSAVSAGVEVTLQTFHPNTTDLDALRISFIDPRYRSAVAVEFTAEAGQLSWKHGSWAWNADARSYIPYDIRVRAVNSRYIVEFVGVIDGSYVALHDYATPTVPAVYADIEHFAKYTGKITARHSGAVLASWANVPGNGEFATPYVPFDSDSWRSTWNAMGLAFYDNHFRFGTI